MNINAHVEAHALLSGLKGWVHRMARYLRDALLG
jgi:hypothetical protein